MNYTFLKVFILFAKIIKNKTIIINLYHDFCLNKKKIVEVVVSFKGI